VADDGVTVQLVGHQDVVDALNNLRDELPRSWLKNALKDGAQFLYEALLRYVPYKTGKLARNISVRTQQAGDWMRARVTVNTIGKADDPANAFYWRFLEKGWHDRAGRAHVEEFLKSPIEAHEQRAAQMVIDAVGAAIDEAEAKAR